MPRKPKECKQCGRSVSTSFICRRCGRELRDLLAGDGIDEPVEADKHSKGQPGIVWYISRLRETAYRQTLMERNLGAKTSRSGYYLLGSKPAIDLLGKISFELSDWSARLDGLTAPHAQDDDGSGVIAWPDGLDGLDAWRVRYLADHIPELRHHCADVDILLKNLLQYVRDAWRIINRPNDICCGACPNLITDQENPNGPKVACDAMLYAEEFETTVQCLRCRAQHDVSQMRDELIRRTHNMLFTGSELLRLMETRINDRMPKSTFYQLIKDGRLQPRGYDSEDAPMYTYDDVCEARSKPVPGRRLKHA